jgi:hypothetical protein
MKGEPRETAPADVQREPIQVFGTIANTRRRLKLEHLSYADVRKALQGEPARTFVIDDVTDAWRAWKRQFLLGATRGRAFPSFDLQDEDAETLILQEFAP